MVFLQFTYNFDVVVRGDKHTIYLLWHLDWESFLFVFQRKICLFPHLAIVRIPNFIFIIYKLLFWRLILTIFHFYKGLYIVRILPWIIHIFNNYQRASRSYWFLLLLICSCISPRCLIDMFHNSSLVFLEISSVGFDSQYSILIICINWFSKYLLVTCCGIDISDIVCSANKV